MTKSDLFRTILEFKAFKEPIKFEISKIPPKPIQIQKPLTQKEILSTKKPPTNFGKVKSMIDPLQSFIDLQIKESGNATWKSKVLIPEWFLELISRTSKKEELFDEILKQIQKKPSRENLLFGQLIINELIQFSGGDKFLFSRLTQKLISQFQAVGEKK